MPQDASTLLRVALASNLALSLMSGLVALSFCAGIAASVGALPAWLIMGIGGGLIVFAAGIAWTLLRLRIGHALARHPGSRRNLALQPRAQRLADRGRA